MPVWEKVFVALFLAIAAPISLLVAGWWAAATLSMSGVYPLADASIATAAWTGLLLGVAMVAWRTPRWIRGFYVFPLHLAIPLYLFWTAIATAWFMGLPIGNLALGSFAGAYVGRRTAHARQPLPAARRAVLLSAAFTTSVTAMAALAIGLLAMREPYTLAFVRQTLATGRFVPDGVADAMLVAAAVVGIFVLQFGLTSAFAQAAMRLPTANDGRPA